jgi:hypothetical protein
MAAAPAGGSTFEYDARRRRKKWLENCPKQLVANPAIYAYGMQLS